MQLEPVRLVLADLAEMNGVRAALFVARDGLPLAAVGDVVERGGGDLRAALVAAVFASVDRAISQLGINAAETVTVETSSHTLHVAGCGDYLLAVVAERRTNPAQVRWEMRRAAERLLELVPRPKAPSDGARRADGQSRPRTSR